MSKLNEKLTASVKPAASRVGTAKGKAGALSAEPPVKAKRVVVPKAAVGMNGEREPRPSGEALFPERVWPD